MTRPHEHPPRGRRAARQPGYTLVEVSVSLVIVSVLLVATGSAIVLASRAVPQRTGVAGQVVSAARALEQLRADLTYATAVNELGPNAIGFTVPDRTGDGAPEVIRWSWEARAGAPLTRSVNGAAAAVVLDDVREFALVYDRRRQTLPPSYTESPETLLLEQESGSPGFDFPITSSNWSAQTVRPTLGGGTAWWTVTRVVVCARKSGSTDGETRVQLCAADLLGKPTSIVHDHAALLENSLDTSYRWAEVGFARRAPLAPDAAACIVLRWMSGSNACELSTRTAAVPAPPLVTLNAGATWTPAATQALQIRVYGVTATIDPPRYRYTLNDVRVALRAGDHAAGAVSVRVATANLPEVPAP